MNDPMPGKEPSNWLSLSVFRERLSVYVCAFLPFGFEGGVWDLIVLVPCQWFSLRRRHNGQLHRHKNM